MFWNHIHMAVCGEGEVTKTLTALKQSPATQNPKNKVQFILATDGIILETVPEIEANCFSLEKERLTDFIQVISNVETDGPKLSLGKFTLDDDAIAYLNGNKLFQRHAIIVGSTGSGKS